jgi:type II secretory pathway pseudopilin PulG
MQSGRTPHGYTIVEVLVFMAVSSFMFVLAAIFINGKQSSAEFTQAVNNVDAQIRETIDDVKNGFYPSNSNFTCSASLSSGRPTFSSAAHEQGTNQDCIFLGKSIQFAVHGSNNSQYNVFSIVGRRLNNAMNAEVTSLSGVGTATFPTPLAPPFTGATGIDVTDAKTVPWSVKVTRVYYFPNSSPGSITDTGAVAFLSSLANYNVTTNLLNSGAQRLSLASVPGAALDQTAATASTNIGNMTDANVHNDYQFVVCLAGGASHKASINIGTNNAGLTTEVKIGGVSAGC